MSSSKMEFFNIRVMTKNEVSVLPKRIILFLSPHQEEIKTFEIIVDGEKFTIYHSFVGDAPKCVMHYNRDNYILFDEHNVNSGPYYVPPSEFKEFYAYYKEITKEFCDYSFLQIIDKHNNCHTLDTEQCGSKANKNPRDFALEHLHEIEKYITNSQYVKDPAKLALIPVDDTIIGYDSLAAKDVSQFYENMPIDMKVGEKREINDMLHWELRMYADFPVIVDKSEKSKIATHIAIILGPGDVVWTAYPANGIEGVAPQITKENLDFWKNHVFSG